MNDMSWEERMAARAQGRQVVQEAEEVTRWDAEFPAVPGEDGVTPWARHHGHRTHLCNFAIMRCSCGAVLGTGCCVIADEPPPSCEVCRARGIGEFAEAP